MFFRKKNHISLSSKVLILVVTVFLFYPVANSSAQQHGWEKIYINGHQYVSFKDIKRFFGFRKINIQGKKIILEHRETNSKKDVTIEFLLGSQRCKMNGWLFILSSPVIKDKGKYLISSIDFEKLINPVLRPKHIHKARPVRTVVLDPGHGGHDSGSRGTINNEKYYALKVSRMVREHLRTMGYRVVMTRDSDVFVSLENRVKTANSYPNAIFISIHFNAGHPQANGIETFTISPRGVPHMDREVIPDDFQSVAGNIMDSASIALGTAVHVNALRFLNDKKYNGKFNIEDRGIKRARFNVLTGIKIPATLLEAGFLTNKKEGKKIDTSAYQRFLAASIAQAVRTYCNSVGSTSR